MLYQTSSELYPTAATNDASLWLLTQKYLATFIVFLSLRACNKTVHRVSVVVHSTTGVCNIFRTQDIGFSAS